MLSVIAFLYSIVNFAVKKYVRDVAAAMPRPGLFYPRPMVATPAVLQAIRPGAWQVSTTRVFRKCAPLQIHIQIKLHAHLKAH